MVTEWYPADTHPVRGGLYQRDWSHTDILPVGERRVCFDWWEPVNNRCDSLYPGVWYTWPDLNDATWQNLPWRGRTKP